MKWWARALCVAGAWTGTAAMAMTLEGGISNLQFQLVDLAPLDGRWAYLESTGHSQVMADFIPVGGSDSMLFDKQVNFSTAWTSTFSVNGMTATATLVGGDMNTPIDGPGAVARLAGSGAGYLHAEAMLMPAGEFVLGPHSQITFQATAWGSVTPGAPGYATLAGASLSVWNLPNGQALYDEAVASLGVGYLSDKALESPHLLSATVTNDTDQPITANVYLGAYAAQYQVPAQAVPEPGTWALLGAGLAVLSLAARRRQR